MVTKIDIEKKAISLHSKRQKVYELNAEIGVLRNEIINWMMENNERRIKIGNISLEIAHRDKRFADYNIIQDYIDKGVLPKETLKISKIHILNIISAKDFKLNGNKFLIK